MTETIRKTVKRLGITDKAYLEQLYLDSVDKEEILDFIKKKFSDQYEKVRKLPLLKLKITIYNLIQRCE